MATLYVKLQTSTSGGGLCEGEKDDEPYQQHETKFIELTMLSAHWDRGEEFWPDDDVNADDSLVGLPCVFLPVVRYYDGDTFGSCEGYHSFGPVCGILEEAKAWDPDAGSDYKPWQGYFSGESYTGIEYYRFDMANNGEAWLVCHKGPKDM